MILSEQILALRNEGKSYRQIEAALGCSKSTIAYHLSEGEKDRVRSRTIKARSDNPLIKKVDQFRNTTRKTEVATRRAIPLDKAIRDKVGDYQKVEKKYNTTFTPKDLLDKVGDNPICYLSGRPIDLTQTSTYHLDHIIPRSKGGDNSLENLGLAEKHANLAKSNLSVAELLELCADILKHNGYTVSKSGE